VPGARRIGKLSRNPMFGQIGRFVDGLVHPSVADDALVAARHRAFIAANLLGGLCALAILPLYLAWIGTINGHAVVSFAFLAAQAPIGLFLSRTGRFEAASLAGSVAFAGLIAWVAMLTGGLTSPALLWLVLVPVEGALSGSRRVIFGSMLVAAAGLTGVAVSQASGLMPGAFWLMQPIWVAQFCIVLAGLLYGGLVALRSDSFFQTSLKALEDREARYRVVGENMTDVVSLHSANGDTVFISPAVTKLFGIEHGDAIGAGLFHRVHVADRPAYLKTLSDALANGEPGSVEFRGLRSVGGGVPASYIWLEMRCQPLSMPDPVNGNAEVVAVIRDITARKQQEDELRHARTAAEEASNTKTRFLANVSHELRTPLNAIIGFSEILSEGIAFPDQAARTKEYAKLIHDSGHHLLQVVNDILDMSKIESGNFEIVAEPFDLTALLDNCSRLMEHQAAERGVSIVTQCDGSLPEIVADRRACKQILLNLLSNSVKFTNPGGRIVLGCRREGTRVAIIVADDGIGIAEQDIPNLGNPFFQADSGYDRRHDGTGLGLSVVNGLVKLHGGSVNISSQLGKGTDVTIWLPINCEAAAEPINARAKPKMDHGVTAEVKRLAG